MAQSDAGLWQALADHAGGIQAVAAVLTVAAVLVLVAVAWRAIATMRRVAAVIEAQLAAQQEISAARRSELLALVQMFEGLLADLPASSDDSERLRGCALWDEHDLSRLQRLAAELGPDCGERAALAGAPLRWLRERQGEVKAIRPDVPVRWDHFPWPRWADELERARSLMAETASLVRGEAGPPRTTRGPSRAPAVAPPAPPVPRVSHPVAVG